MKQERVARPERGVIREVESSMVWKLAVLIVGIGVIGGGLLATRQQRIQAAHELADVQRRVTEHDRELWKLRIEIARRVEPAEVSRRVAELGPMAPIGPFRYQELVARESAGLMEQARGEDGEDAGEVEERLRKSGGVKGRRVAWAEE